ncbi:phenylalanyl-tRNA synthetase subunit alpha [Christiangramia echinicola]|uniref:phenylalanyl-tRNA synthetase subunit alpha n=1 Tax=Christiangramia echinicola TaxID=279359 RepID=UPI00041ACB17|nr:phenylalanyl-tRNA synthetase subunit alpha [Christiangramia echinicola]
MKKDIEIPEVKDVHVAAVKVLNEEFQAMEWNVYLINDSEEEIDMVLIVSKGFDKKKETSLMRHKIEVLPSKNFAKIEYLQDDVLKLNNEFKVTYFANNKMMEKTFLFKPYTINETLGTEIPIIPEKGILAI